MIYVKLFLTAVFWGGTFIAGRVLAQEVEPYSGSFLRFLVASVCMIPLVWHFEGRLQQRSWKDDNGGNHNITEVNVDGFEFLDAKKDGESGNKSRQESDIPPPPSDDYGPPSGGKGHFNDTDIPF